MLIVLLVYWRRRRLGSPDSHKQQAQPVPVTPNYEEQDQSATLTSTLKSPRFKVEAEEDEPDVNAVRVAVV